MAHKTSYFLNIFPQNIQIMLSLGKKVFKNKLTIVFILVLHPVCCLNSNSAIVLEFKMHSQFNYENNPAIENYKHAMPKDAIFGK